MSADGTRTHQTEASAVERARIRVAQLQAIFERSLHAMLIVDDDRRYRDANPAACGLLRRSRDELLRLRVDDLAAPDLADSLDEAWERFLAGGQQSGRYDLCLPDGGRLHVEYSAVARILPGRHLSIFLPVPAGQVAPEPDRARPDWPLSEREREVLARLAMGATGKAIASAMYLSPETVRTHIRNAMRKLGATTRAHAIAIALSEGIITPR
jgi:PAS domain S-box-containing protein